LSYLGTKEVYFVFFGQNWWGKLDFSN
jgi:hypothetical protein